MTKRNINVKIYFLCTWLFSVFLCAGFLRDIPNDSLRDQIDTLLVLPTYGLMYQAPAMLAYWLLKRWQGMAIGAAVAVSMLGHLFVFSDSHLFDLYGFHINGFVWNLLTSPGGIDSLGADQTNILVVFAYVAVLLALHAASLSLAVKFPRVRIPTGRLALLFLLATLAERSVYGYSVAELYGPVMERGEAMPLYQPMTMNSLLASLGMEVKTSSHFKLEETTGRLNYPRHPVNLSKVDRPMNIVMLVSESMRWDLLSPEVMPNMTAFAQQSWNFTGHFSGGNGTRQGLFALFYGIPGSYWNKFLLNRQGPVLFDVLGAYNYQYFIYTGAKFTYPEFDQTIFSRIPPDKLIENNTGEPWQRDEANTTALINDMKGRDRSRPFYGFLFYEGTHARYSFPGTAVVRDDYARSLDYATLSRTDLAPQIAGMKARYENAAHEIDLQLQRVVDFLETSGELENTLVIVTGDHGEEFMEHGRWGHNSAFTDWQVHVPMIVRMPGSSSRTISQRTSHIDVVPSILTRLGIQNPVKDYSLGVDLLTPQEHRTILVASWSDLGLINDYGKLVIPFKSTTQHQNLATDLDDVPVDGGDLLSRMESSVVQALADARYYSQ